MPQLGKTAIKLVATIYFIIDSQGSYINVYIYGYAGLLIAYIFFFRLFTLHQNNQNYFYF
jgi:hypothetical protein